MKALLFVVSFFTFHICYGAPVVGDQAPEFSLKASDGQTYSLSEFKGKSPVVIAFFPKAFTGG